MPLPGKSDLSKPAIYAFNDPEWLGGNFEGHSPCVIFVALPTVIISLPIQQIEINDRNKYQIGKTLGPWRLSAPKDKSGTSPPKGALAGIDGPDGNKNGHTARSRTRFVGAILSMAPPADGDPIIGFLKGALERQSQAVYSRECDLAHTSPSRSSLRSA